MPESPIDQLLKPVSRFINQEFTGGITLFASVFAALIRVNAPWEPSYYAL